MKFKPYILIILCQIKVVIAGLGRFLG